MSCSTYIRINLMKKALLLIPLAAISISAFAQGKAKPAPKKKTTCPVMKGNPVDIAAATKAKMFADYKGRRYFFCCGMCPPAFKKNPEKFANKAISIPTPKKKA
jgi:YHS domain-containing protein